MQLKDRLKKDRLVAAANESVSIIRRCHQHSEFNLSLYLGLLQFPNDFLWINNSHKVI